MFAWTPPLTDNKAYQKHLKSATNNIAEQLLQQLEVKQALVERNTCVCDKQDKLDDGVSTIGNFSSFPEHL